MKLVSALVVLVLITGCSTRSIPITQTWPEAAPVMLEKCPDLKTIDKPEVKLSELMKTVIENYTEYHRCRDLVTLWQQWYKIHGQEFQKLQTENKR